MIIGASQTWTGNATTTTFASTIAGAAGVGTTVSPDTLTLNGGNYSQTAGGFSDGSGGVLSLTITGGAGFSNNKGNAASYTGGTNILSGSTSVKNSAGYGTGAITLGSTTAATSATVSFVAGGTTANNIIAQGSGTNAFNQGSAGNTLSVSGTVALNNTTNALVLTTTASSTGNAPGLAFTNVISGSGGLAVTQSAGARNTFVVTLGGANTYSGGTTLNFGTTNINNGGTATSSAIGTGALTIGGVTIDNTSGAAVTLATNNAVAVNGNFSYVGTGSLNFGTGAVSLGTATGTARTITTNAATAGTVLTIGGVISNGTTATGITKAGAGTLALGGANAYTGTTAVNAGTLLVNNTTGSGTGSGAVTVASGATLGGTGILANTTGVTISNGGTITTASGALTLNAPLTLSGVLQLAVNGAVSTPLTVGGNLALTTATATLAISGTLDGTSTYDVANYSGTETGAFSNAISGYTVNYAGTTFGAADIELDPGGGTRAFHLGGGCSLSRRGCFFRSSARTRLLRRWP